MFKGAPSCNASRTRTCPMLFNRCANLFVMMEIPGSPRLKTYVMKNCSTSVSCASGSLLNPCKVVGNSAMNATGLLRGCGYSCCKGDLCNGEGANKNPKSAATGQDMTAFLGAVFVSLVALLFFHWDPLPNHVPRVFCKCDLLSYFFIIFFTYNRRAYFHRKSQILCVFDFFMFMVFSEM